MAVPFLTIGEDLQLHYSLLEEDNSGPYLVFLHEGLGCEAMWKGFPQELCRLCGLPGLVYDRRGYGLSSSMRRQRTIHYLHNYALIELPALLRAVIPDQPYVLIGHSDGATISLIRAAERPALLRGVVSEAAHVFVESETVAGIRKAQEAWQEGKFAKLAEYHGEKTTAVFTSWTDTWCSDWFRSWSIEYLLPSIEVPLLVVQGADDQYGTRAQVDSIVSRTSGPAREALVDSCGHIPHLEQRVTVAELIREFLIDEGVIPSLS